MRLVKKKVGWWGDISQPESVQGEGLGLGDRSSPGRGTCLRAPQSLVCKSFSPAWMLVTNSAPQPPQCWEREQPRVRAAFMSGMMQQSPDTGPTSALAILKTITRDAIHCGGHLLVASHQLPENAPSPSIFPSPPRLSPHAPSARPFSQPFLTDHTHPSVNRCPPAVKLHSSCPQVADHAGEAAD